MKLELLDLIKYSKGQVVLIVIMLSMSVIGCLTNNVETNINQNERLSMETVNVYFKEIEKVKSINVVEITENNFVIGIDKEIDTTLVDKLISVKNEIHLSDTVVSVNEYDYQINMYDENENNLYIWIIKDEHIYSEDGHEILFEGINKWIYDSLSK